MHETAEAGSAGHLYGSSPSLTCHLHCLDCSSFLEHQSAQALAEAKRTVLCRDCIVAVCSRFHVCASAPVTLNGANVGCPAATYM